MSKSDAFIDIIEECRHRPYLAETYIVCLSCGAVLAESLTREQIVATYMERSCNIVVSDTELAKWRRMALENLRRCFNEKYIRDIIIFIGNTISELPIKSDSKRKVLIEVYHELTKPEVVEEMAMVADVFAKVFNSGVTFYRASLAYMSWIILLKSRSHVRNGSVRNIKIYKEIFQKRKTWKWLKIIRRMEKILNRDRRVSYIDLLRIISNLSVK